MASRSPKAASVAATHYDEAYFKRWYGTAQTRAFTKTDKDIRAAFVVAYMKQLKIPLRSVCDLGCGLGHWQQALRKLLPKMTYTGVEYSPYLCARYGWTEASAATYAPRRRFDLVICQSVLHHLNDRDCAAALDHIASYCKGVLYLEVVSQQDWNQVIDRAHTDPNIFLRSGAWYKTRLKKHFVPLGGGLFLAKSAGIPLLEIEQP